LRAGTAAAASLGGEEGGKTGTTNERARSGHVVIKPRRHWGDGHLAGQLDQNKPIRWLQPPWLRAMERTFIRASGPVGGLGALKAKAAGPLMPALCALYCGSEPPCWRWWLLSLAAARPSHLALGSSTSCCPPGWCGPVHAADHRELAGLLALRLAWPWPAGLARPRRRERCIPSGYVNRSPAARRRRSATCRPSTRCLERVPRDVAKKFLPPGTEQGKPDRPAATVCWCCSAAGFIRQEPSLIKRALLNEWWGGGGAGCSTADCHSYQLRLKRSCAAGWQLSWTRRGILEQGADGRPTRNQCPPAGRPGRPADSW